MERKPKLLAIATGTILTGFTLGYVLTAFLTSNPLGPQLPLYVLVLGIEILLVAGLGAWVLATTLAS